MRPTILGAGLVVFTACAAFGQTQEIPASFEVASVKPAAPQTGPGLRVMMRGGPGTPDPGQITYSNVSMKNLLQNAYGVKGFQISGPNWIESERFDIVAKVPQGATKEQFKVMLQNLLAERFKLTVHHETRELPAYALVVGKNGPKLKESAADDPAAKDGGGPPDGPDPPKITMGKDGMPKFPAGPGRNGMMVMVVNGRIRLQANKQTASGLADMLGDRLDRPVLDMTGLKGNYDFTLDYAPDEGQHMGGPMGMPPTPPGGEGPGPMAGAADNQGPDLFTALQEQLGLKLEPRKGPADLVVIDHLEKVPTEN